jgi:hypothetical protein
MGQRRDLPDSPGNRSMQRAEAPRQGWTRHHHTAAGETFSKYRRFSILPLAELPSSWGAIRRRHRSASYAGPSGAPPGSRRASRDRAKLEVNIGVCAERIRLGVGNGGWGYIVGTYDKDAGPNNQRLYLNGARVARMGGTQPIDLYSAALGIGRHVNLQRPYRRVPHLTSAFAAATAEEHEGAEPPPLAGAGRLADWGELQRPAERVG